MSIYLAWLVERLSDRALSTSQYMAYWNEYQSAQSRAVPLSAIDALERAQTLQRAIEPPVRATRAKRAKHAA